MLNDRSQLSTRVLVGKIVSSAPLQGHYISYSIEYENIEKQKKQNKLNFRFIVLLFDFNLLTDTYKISKLPLPSLITSGSNPDKSIIVDGILSP
jgi:hypothetical protein